MEVDGLHLTFVHGSIDDPLNGRIYPDTIVENLNKYTGLNYVFMGHTHHKLSIQLNNGTMLFNPGSIGQQRDGKGCTYGVFDTSCRQWTIKEIVYDKEKLVNEVLEHNETEQMKRKLIDVLYRDKR